MELGKPVSVLISCRIIVLAVQNADDNDYPDGAVPKLELQIDATRLTMRNNEIGFLPKHVESICNIADSTKKNLTGYIGAHMYHPPTVSVL